MTESQDTRRTLGLILVPMLGTFLTQRTILHHSSPDSHVFVAGYLVHHLFSGALLQIAAAFVIAFGARSPRVRDGARIVLGVGTAMILDEIIFLVCTDGSGEAYRGRTSLWGAVVLISLAALSLLTLCKIRSRPQS